MEQPATTLKELSPGVWCIEQEMVRSFLIVGTQRCLLLDTGAAPCDMMALIRTVTDLPVTLVHSHGDGDHTENDSQFSDIYAHPDEFPVIYRFRPELKSTLHPIGGETVFDLGGRSLQVVEIPGHTPGSICLLDRENRILFSGDSLSYGPVFLFGDHRDIHTFRKTLDMLSELDGFDTVYPCHNTCPVSPDVISGLKQCVDGALDGSIVPTPCEMPMPDGLNPHVYSYGTCSILYA